MTSHVTVRDDAIDRISPNLYGHFAEHLGRCIYGGIWVGEDDPLETVEGIRRDTLDLLRDLDLPVLRWPGGCFADDYHWEDGVGPRDERPRKRNLWWTQGRENVPEEPNDFGTDEFLRFCELLETDAYLAVNVGSSTPEEALDWIEYCNYGGDTDLTRRRAENGHEEPYDVAYWGIGNENWGCGGRFSPEEYADQYRRFANYFDGFDRLMNDAATEFVACGHIRDDWNRAFLDQLADGSEHGPGAFLGMGSPYNLLDHYSVHRYYQAGDDADFDDEEYYRLLARSRKVAADVDRAAAALGEYLPDRDVGIIVDEWGAWHPQAKADNGLEQANTVRDALAAAGVFDDLQARADVVTMANIAQTVNVLQCVVQTDEEAAWATPTYHVFDLYADHGGGTALPTDVDAAVREFDDEPHDVPLVSAAASDHGDGLYLTASNRRRAEPEDVTVDLPGDYAVGEATVLFEGSEVRDRSTRSTADEFGPESFDGVSADGTTARLELPPSSVVGIEFEA